MSKKPTARSAPAATVEQPTSRVECPGCGCRHLPVVYTRRNEQGIIVRRRECRNCGRRITTTERPRKA